MTGVGEDFATFCSNLAIKNRNAISLRYEQITRRLNLEFWNIDSKGYHSIYVGSYGRNTATGATSDVDMIFWLPASYYKTYNHYVGNGQSALLQLCRNALQKTYSTTQIGADGQVIVVSFSDGVTFEVLPAFENILMVVSPTQIRITEGAGSQRIHVLKLLRLTEWTENVMRT